jgi:hypothetical protein
MSGQSIQVVETYPDEIRLHSIEEHQLSTLADVSRPITLAIASALFGTWASFAPSAMDSLSSVGTSSFSKQDLVYCLIDTSSLLCFIVFAAAFIKSEIAARRVIAEIKARKTRSA